MLRGKSISTSPRPADSVRATTTQNARDKWGSACSADQTSKTDDRNARPRPHATRSMINENPTRQPAIAARRRAHRRPPESTPSPGPPSRTRSRQSRPTKTRLPHQRPQRQKAIASIRRRPQDRRTRAKLAISPHPKMERPTRPNIQKTHSLEIPTLVTALSEMVATTPPNFRHPPTP